MRWLRIILIRNALKLAMKSPCSDRIPRSGEEGERVNCFSATLQAKPGGPEISVRAVDRLGIKGLAWNAREFSEECVVPNRNLPYFEVEIRRYYGLQMVSYGGPLSAILGEVAHYPFLKWSWDEINQWMFNWRTPIRFERMRVLRYLIERKLAYAAEKGFAATGYEGVTPHAIMQDFLGERIFEHPRYKRRIAELAALLESLVSSEDATREPTFSYAATPQAWKTLAEYEEADRTQRTSQTQAWWTIGLTVVVAIATCIQAWVAWRATP